MKRIAIVDGIRTPFIKYQTLFRDMPAHELGRVVVDELIQRTELDRGAVDEVVFGCVANPPEASNVARIIQLLAGIPESKRAITVSRNCASGLESVSIAAEKIRSGVDRIVIAGGTESMSNIPLLYRKKIQEAFFDLFRSKTFMARAGNFLKLNPVQLLNPVVGLRLGLTDPICGLNMGETAEILAREFGISRREQDEFALMSHMRAAKAREKLSEETTKVYIRPKFKNVVAEDNGIRENQSMEALTKLKPVFDRKNGTVTAGNSSQITDGASALLVMSEEKAKAMGYVPLGYIKDYVYEGLAPSRMGLGPAYAIPSVLKKAGCELKDIELLEINEAFAAQVIACQRALTSEKFCRDNLGLSGAAGEINTEILNVNGGAIALGHPVGASGNRMILTLLKEMKRRNLNLGLVALCIGGGQGGAFILERE